MNNSLQATLNIMYRFKDICLAMPNSHIHITATRDSVVDPLRSFQPDVWRSYSQVLWCQKRQGIVTSNTCSMQLKHNFPMLAVDIQKGVFSSRGISLEIYHTVSLLMKSMDNNQSPCIMTYTMTTNQSSPSRRCIHLHLRLSYKVVAGQPHMMAHML